METRSLLPALFSSTERHPFRALQKQIDQLFSDFSRDLPLGAWEGSGAIGLAVDVTETDNAIEVTADLPGVEEKDIDVTLAGDVLTIRGQKQAKKDEKGKDYRISERSFGSFERSMALPFRADPGKVDAKFDRGVLKVTVTKPAEVRATTQKIPVKAAA